MEPGEQEIQEIVRKAKEGCRDSVARLFEIFSDRIYRFLRMRVSDKESAEDLTQTVFLEMIHSLDRYRTRKNAKFSTWLFQIAQFRLIDHYRKNRVTEELPDNISDCRKITLESNDPALEKALAMLPEKYRTVLHLRFKADLSVKETARIMGVSSINTRVIQNRALKEMRKLMQENYV